MDIKEKLASIETSLRWHRRLLLALYGLLGLFLLSLLSKVMITGFSVINVMEVNSMDWSIFQPLLIVLAALLRSILGWAKASFKDGYIQEYEIKKLGETVVRVGLIGAIVIYFPWINLTLVEAGAVTLGGDLMLNLVKKIRAPKA